MEHTLGFYTLVLATTDEDEDVDGEWTATPRIRLLRLVGFVELHQSLQSRNAYGSDDGWKKKGEENSLGGNVNWRNQSSENGTNGIAIKTNTDQEEKLSFWLAGMDFLPVVNCR